MRFSDMKRQLAIFGSIIFLSLSNAYSQCAMCKATVESSEGGGEVVKTGINEGILYLMPVPYILLGLVGFVLYRNYKKKQANT
jgi:hypothetical protein